MNRPLVEFLWIRNRSYSDVWNMQTSLHQQLVQRKLAVRSGSGEQAEAPLHYVLFCEHNPVYTLGKSGSETHLLLNEAELQQRGVEFFRINRGGDITFHGPGQITAYPIFDLEYFFTDVHRYVRFLEEAVIRVLARYDLNGIRLPDYTGVWLAPDHTSPSYRKICAIGVHLSRWVTLHGLAFNINTSTDWFSAIVPCGITDEDKTVTSLSRETGQMHDMEVVGRQLLTELQELFGFEIVTMEEIR